MFGYEVIGSAEVLCSKCISAVIQARSLVSFAPFNVSSQDLSCL